VTTVKGAVLERSRKETLNKIFWDTVQQYPEIKAVSYMDQGRLRELKYQEYGEKVRFLSQGLTALGLAKGDKVSLLAATCFEWVWSDFAILTAGGATVTIYPTLTSRAVKYIVENSDSTMIFVEDKEQLEKVLEVWGDLPDLKHVIVMKPRGVGEKERIHSIDSVVEQGKKFAAQSPEHFETTWKSVDPGELSSIVYTSGTTGLPKGTMLSHWNWVFNVVSVTQVVSLQPGDAHLAFLPLAHVYMRLVYFAAVEAGASVCFGTPDTLAEDLPRVRPVSFVSVPRLFERVYSRMLDQMEAGPPLRRRIFFWASKAAREMGRAHSQWKTPSLGLKLRYRLANRLVFTKIRSKLGVDRLKWTCSSGSALSRDLAYFFNGMGVIIIEGYGMTEAAAPTNLNPVERRKPGTVGPPIPGIVQKIAEDGEILIKGDNIMMGYYKLPEETKESFTEDGWLKTGDIGEFDEDGYLIFKERKKNILVLSTGKNIAPLPLEEALKKSRWIDEAVVVGDNRRYISALIQPSYAALLEYADSQGIDHDKGKTEYQEMPTGESVPVRVDGALLSNPAILEVFQAEVNQVNAGFEHFEQVKKFKLLDRALSVEAEELTPTLKVKRKNIEQKNRELIEGLYTAS